MNQSKILHSPLSTLHSLNVVALNTPYPPNYGGIIDIYHKISALHDLGINIILHVFEYERPQAPQLEAICRQVHYYPRQTGINSNFSRLPYNVYSRRDPQLVQNLMQNQHPILYEGLHSCYTISDPRLADRIKICRTSNIEHDYYYHIAKACRNPIHKAFHLIEAIKFKNFQKNLRHAALILPISTTDAHYLKNIFPAHLVKFIPAFHPDNAINAKAGAGNYLLYHAKLSVHENEQIARYLITKIIPNIAVTCIIAGMNPSAKLKKDIARLPNARLIPNPDDDSMNQLIANAHIHILPTFQPTGLKLKLLKSLFNGRHIIVNSKMLAGTGLDHLCHIADNQEDIIQTINRLMLIPFSDKEIQLRRQTLLPFFTSHHQAQQLIRLISNCEPQQRATATPST